MKARRFYLYHFSLLVPRQPSLLAPEMERGKFLQARLGTMFPFQGRGGAELIWVPRATVNGIIIGLIQKKGEVRHHQPPEEGGAEVKSDLWQGAYVLIDTQKHEEGQRVAVESDVVGQPASLLKSLVAHLNADVDAAYVVEFDPIFSSKEFWDYSRENGDMLEWIKFDFAVPNMWDAEGELDEELRETGEQTGAQRVTVVFKGKRGIFTRNQKVQDAVRYSERGAGQIVAKAPGRSPFRSTSTQETTSVITAEEGSDSVVSYLESSARSILGQGDG